MELPDHERCDAGAQNGPSDAGSTPGECVMKIRPEHEERCHRHPISSRQLQHAIDRGGDAHRDCESERMAASGRCE